MKKKLLFVMGMASALLSTAQCTELFISAYVAGGGNNKAIQLYNPTQNYIVLDGSYRLSLYDNGATAVSTYALLHGQIAPGSTFLLVNGQVTNDTVHPATGAPYVSPMVDPNLTAMANQQDSAHFYAFSYFNGDDALSLDKMVAGHWTPVDIFASIGEYPTTGTSHYGWSNVSPYSSPTAHKLAWTYHHTMIRKATVEMGVTVNPAPGVFNPGVEYDTLPMNSYPGMAHPCNCPMAAGVHNLTESVSVNVYPNPTATGIMNVVTGKPVQMVQVYNLVGEMVIEEKFANSAIWISLDLSNLPKGTYILKSFFSENETHVSKVITQ
jgi:hypothetical protein